jgi:hypothetical protein
MNNKNKNKPKNKKNIISKKKIQSYNNHNNHNNTIITQNYNTNNIVVSFTM